MHCQGRKKLAPNIVWIWIYLQHEHGANKNPKQKQKGQGQKVKNVTLIYKNKYKKIKFVKLGTKSCMFEILAKVIKRLIIIR